MVTKKHSIIVSFVKKIKIHMYYYQVFGLVLKSELELPELRSTNNTISDIHIKIGPTPSRLNAVVFKGALFESSPNEFLFSNDIVSFYIKNGKTILVQPKKDAAYQDIRLFILGTGMGVILHQRGLLPMHGSSIAHNNRAYIFSGTSTSGKSSLAAALALKDNMVLADDISVIMRDNKGMFLVYPGIPQLKIWQDVRNALNLSSVTKRVRPQLEKYIVSHQIEFSNDAVPLEAICFLNIKKSEGFEYTRLSGAEKFFAIRNNTFRMRILDSSGQSSTHFQIASDLANSVDLYSIARPALPLNIQELADYVEQNFFNRNENGI